MMVIFVSQCEKNALKKTRRVLDAFANRIGDNTWQTVITEDGLQTVKKMLRQTASKSTAVSCHWLRSRSRSEFLWVVGNRQKFNEEGVVPVNRTQNQRGVEDWENNWIYLPAIKALTAVAALLHDWGKASALFQKKLESSKFLADPLRHEWISCLLLHALIQESGDTSNDAAWLTHLGEASFDEAKLIKLASQAAAKPLADLPPIAQLVAWLIVTHHRLPLPQDKDSYKDIKRESITAVLNSITADWGYSYPCAAQRKKECFNFQKGILSGSKPWLKALKRWAHRLQEARPLWEQLLSNGAWRVALHHARIALVLGDHYYSSCDDDKAAWGKRHESIALYANTWFKDGHTRTKQFLDQHILGVSEQALRVCQSLGRFTSDMEFADAPPGIRKKSPVGFEWQDIAAQKIRALQKQPDTTLTQRGGFIVNMASTGCGKTVANAKIIRAFSEDGERLRFILALGLRTLTLQTGDEYRHRLCLNESDLAVLIGSSAVKELHEKAQAKPSTNEPDLETQGAESQESLLDEELNYDESPTAEFLDVLFPSNRAAQSQKNKAFLYKPVLVCTIDHLMSATEATRGGRAILPALRLLSSDLVIDEIDQFGEQDLIAIGRLIHLAGMLGRKVMISSATIPPALAEGFFHAYQEGWKIHRQFLSASGTIICAWVDEFQTEVRCIDWERGHPARTEVNKGIECYRAAHQAFVKKRVTKLAKQSVRRKVRIIPCDDLYDTKGSGAGQEKIEQVYFSRIQQTALELHRDHHVIDTKTGKKISFGVVRMANIPPCAALAKHLLQADWTEEYAPKIMVYHSRQVLLMRHVQEKHLDEVLKRKPPADGTDPALNHPLIRQHLEGNSAENVIFILVASPVEEVGRDHDFDWGIIEPSSYCSFIQLAGRVLRHRIKNVDSPNIAILQYNLKALKDGQRKPAFRRPGYEKSGSLKLNCHDVAKLVDLEQLAARLDASPRLEEAEPLDPKNKLADLEHQSMNNILRAYGQKGAGHLEGWLNGYWSLTALPQRLNPFRAGSPEVILYRCWMDEKFVFCERSERGEMIPRSDIRRISEHSDKTSQTERLWLNRDYEVALRAECGFAEGDYLNDADRQLLRKKSERYGEISLPDTDESFIYSDNFGMVQKK